MYFSIFKYCAISYRTTPTGRHRRGWDKERVEGGKKEEKSRRRSLLYMTKSTMTNYRGKLEEVGIDNEDEESIDKENSIRYLRMN
jgi:hypothetical protein